MIETREKTLRAQWKVPIGIKRWTGLFQFLFKTETLEVMEHPELRFAWLSHNSQYITWSEEWKPQADRCPGPVGHTLNFGMEVCVNKILCFQIIEGFFGGSLSCFRGIKHTHALYKPFLQFDLSYVRWKFWLFIKWSHVYSNLNGRAG